MHSVQGVCDPDLYRYFLGAWLLTRTLQGVDGTRIGTAQGKAEFLPQTDAAGLDYHEAGQLQLLADARAIKFSRRFVYQLPQPGWLHVLFADGPQAGQSYQQYRYHPQQQALLPVQTHVCLDDRYEGQYQFIDAHHFDLRTSIDGPHKTYVLQTRFTRVEGTAGALLSAFPS